MTEPGSAPDRRSFAVERPDKDLHLAADERAGDEPPIVFIHGFAGNRSNWDLVWQVLETPRRLIRYDLRGFGGSSGIGCSEYDHVEDFLTFLDACNVRHADLVGVSLGGATALGFALDHPERVRRLTLISPALRGWAWSDSWQKRWDAIKALAQRGDMDAARAAWLAHPIFDTTRGGVAGDYLRTSVAGFSGTHWVDDPHRDVLPDMERLHTLQAPTLLLSGEKDLDEFQLIAAIISEAAAHVERRTIASHGHMLHLERPDMVAEALISHLADTQ